MKWTILGSGGCMVIPKPLCRCPVCREAREKGLPYARTGPSAFLHDIDLLIDTPAEIISQLNRCDIDRIDYITYTHLDPDHVEGSRLVEQMALDFRTWAAYPEKQVTLLLPEGLSERIRAIQSQFGPVMDWYVDRGFVRLEPLPEKTRVGDIDITAIPVDRVVQTAYVYAFDQGGKRVVYAPCDLKPFPEGRDEVQSPDLLIIQPGIFEEGLKHGFHYPADHISRMTLYTFEETMALAWRIGAKQVLFVHLEEYWNRGHDDYLALEREHPHIRFACDGMVVEV